MCVGIFVYFFSSVCLGVFSVCLFGVFNCPMGGVSPRVPVLKGTGSPPVGPGPSWIGVGRIPVLDPSWTSARLELLLDQFRKGFERVLHKL